MIVNFWDSAHPNREIYCLDMLSLGLPPTHTAGRSMNIDAISSDDESPASGDDPARASVVSHALTASRPV
jgi:hypothetical protein